MKAFSGCFLSSENTVHFHSYQRLGEYPSRLPKCSHHLEDSVEMHGSFSR